MTAPTDRVAKAALVLSYLESDQEMYGTLLTLARLEIRARARGVPEVPKPRLRQLVEVEDGEECSVCRRMMGVFAYSDRGEPLCVSCADEG